MKLKTTLLGKTYVFRDLKEVLAKANEEKTGDKLAGLAAETAQERIAAKVVLSAVSGPSIQILYQKQTKQHSKLYPGWLQLQPSPHFQRSVHLHSGLNRPQHRPTQRYEYFLKPIQPAKSQSAAV